MLKSSYVLFDRNCNPRYTTENEEIANEWRRTKERYIVKVPILETIKDAEAEGVLHERFKE